MNREQQFVKNGAILSLGTIVPKMTAIVTLPIITGCLTKAEYGTYDLITILVSLVLPIATLQMQAAAFRYLITLRGNILEQKRCITNIAVFTIPVCLVVLGILYFCLPTISPTTRVLILVYFYVDIVLTTVRQMARGLSLNMAYSISAILNAVIEMLLMVVLLQELDQGLNGTLWALILSQICSLLFLSVKSRILSYMDIHLVSWAQIREMLAYSWPMIPNSLSSWVMRVSDRLVLSIFMGVEANAIYAVANKLPNMFSIIQSTFTLAWQENASISVEDEDAGEYYGRMFDRIFCILVGGMAMLIAFTPVIFRILIRGDYDEAYNHMPILYLAVMFAMISSYMGGIYIAHMKSREIGISTTMAAVTNLVIDLLTVRFIGIYAASLSTLISYFWLAIYRMVDVQKIQKIRFNYKKIILLLMTLAIISVACFMRIVLIDIVNMVAATVLAIVLNRHLISIYMKTVHTHIRRMKG